MNGVKFDILHAPRMAQSELDIAMQPYIDSGNHSKEELAKIRKRLSNQLKEEKERQKKVKEQPKEETRTTPAHVSETKVDVKVPHITTGGRHSDFQIYSKHDGLEDIFNDVSFSDEEDVVPVLNKFYKDKGVDVRFVQTNPGKWTDWISSRTSWDAVEVLMGDQKEGEGYTIELNPSGGAYLHNLTEKLRTHIDTNMGEKYYKTSDSVVSKDKEKIYDEILETYNLGDLFLDDNQTNRARFAHRGDINSGQYEEGETEVLSVGDIQYRTDGTTFISGKGAGQRLREINIREDALGGVVKWLAEPVTFGNFDQYDADMSGGITLKDGTFLPYQYIWDHKEEVKQRALNKAGVNLTKEKIAKFGTEEELNNYIADNAWVYFKEDEQEYYQLKRQLENVRSGKVEGDAGEITSRIEEIAKEKEWKVLYDENGGFVDIKKKEPEEGSEDERIETGAQELASENDLDYLTRERQQSLMRLENLAYIANQNIDEIGEEMAWWNAVGGFFDFSEDSYDNDKKNLEQVANARDIFGSDNPLTTLPGGSELKRAFNEELLNFRTLSRAVDLNVNVAMLPEENEFAEIIDSFGESFFGEGVFGTGDDKARHAFEQILENDGYDVDTLNEHVDAGVFDYIIPGIPGLFTDPGKRVVREKITDFVSGLGPLLTELYFFHKVVPTKSLNLGVNKVAAKFTGAKYFPKLLKPVVHNFVVPGVATTVSWASAELIGEQIMGEGDLWQSHTINTTTGETNFTMPMVMGMSSAAWGMLSNSIYKGFAKKSFGKKILPKLENPTGFFRNTTGKFGKAIGQGTTGSAMLMVAETAQAVIDEAIKGEDYDLAERLKETWTMEHFITTAWALTFLSAQKIAPEVKDAFARDVAHLRGSTVESKAAAEYFKVKETAEEGELSKALQKKIEEIEKDDSLSDKERKEKIKEAETHAKHLMLLRESKKLKADYEKRFGKKGRNKYLQEQWDKSQALKEDITKLTGEQYDIFAKLEPWEVEEFARRNGVDLNSKAFKILQAQHDVIREIVGLTNLMDMSRATELSSGREAYIRNTLKSMINENRIDFIKEKIKDGKGTPKLETELKKLKETNDVLKESNEAFFNKYQGKWNKVLRSRVAAAKALAKKLGGSLKQLNQSQWNKRFADPDADAAYVNGVLYLNMNRIRETKNLGAPIHEVVHHILRNSLKQVVSRTYKKTVYTTEDLEKLEKDNKELYDEIVEKGTVETEMTKEGIEIIDELKTQFSRSELIELENHIDAVYRYKTTPDGKYFELDSKGNKIEKEKKEYYEEYITLIGEGIVNGNIKYNERAMRRAGKAIYPWLKRFMPNLYEYNINGTRSPEAARGLFDMLGDVAAANKVKAETVEGLRKVAEEAPIGKGETAYAKTESPLESINKLIPKNIKTKADYDALIQGERTAKPIIDALNKPGGVINNYIRSRQTSKIEGDKTIEQAVFRLFNFNPEAKRADGTPVGREGFGEAIFANTRFAKLIAREQLFREGERTKREKDIEDVKDLTTPTPKAVPVEFDGRSIKIAPRLGPKALKIHNKVMDTVKFVSEGKLPYMVKPDLSHIDLTKATFKSLKGVALKEVQRMFGVDPKTGNLSKTDVKNAQFFINKHPDLFIAMLPTHHTTKMVNIGTEKAPIWESRPDKATGIQQVLLDAFYRKGTRKDNLTPWYKNENIRTSDFLKVFGIMESGKPNTYKKESNTSARIHALMKQVERMMVNQAVREKLIADGNGQEALASHIAEGKSEVMYAKSVFRNKDVGESTRLEFDRKKRSFHLEIAKQGLSKEAIRRAYDTTFPKGNFTDLGISLRAKIINDYVAMLKPYVTKLESYKTVGEKFPEKIEEFLATVDIAEANLAIRDYMGLKKPMGDYFADPIQKRKAGQFSTDIRSTIINKKLEGVTDSKKIQSIKDQGIVDAIRHKSHLENGEASPKRAMAFYLKSGFIKDHLSKIPGYENLVDYRRKKATDAKTKEVKRWIELEFKDGTVRKIELPESSRFDGEQKTTQEMIKDKVSEAEKVLRKEAADYHWERVIETFETAKKLADGKTYGNVELGMLLAGFLGNMKTSLRAAAEFRYSPVNPPTRKLFERVWNAKKGEYVNKKLWEYEHGIPAKAIALILADHFFRGNKVDLKKLQESYSVGVIHRDFNKNIGEVFQERMQYTYKVGDKPPARWFNTWTAMGEAHVMRDIYTGEIHGEAQVNYWNKVKANHKKLIQQDNNIIKQVVGKRQYSKSSKKETIEDLRIIDRAISLGRIPKKEKRGMSTFDFDETVGVSENYIFATKGKETKKIASHEWPVVGEQLRSEGWKMDFTDFNKVTKGKPGPLMQKLKNQIKKFGNKNVFILTARDQKSAKAIHEWLKSEGVKIPLKNITGLGNSTGEAKAMWMLEKFSEGYNDMYFVDDALSNVKAVKKVLDQLDAKSKVQQAVQYSKTRSKISKDFNQIIEESFKVEAKKSYSEGRGRIAGKDKGRWKFFGTPGAEDLAGLVTYAFAGKGKQGEAHKKFFEDNLHKPYNRAYNDIHARKQNISNDYKALRKQTPNVRKRLNDVVDGVYTVDQAIRVHLWDRAGFEVPGLTKTALKKLTEYVRKDAELLSFADQLSKITMLKDGYLKPKDYWLGENITADMNNVVERVYRKEALAEFVENRKAIFGEWQGQRLVGENMNKIESLLGPKHREALENMLWRMENGTNRMVGKDSNTNRWMNWVNNSVGVIMFFNQKSAALQTISAVNYINGNFNNPFAAARAFANQPQYWKDFMRIMNSDMLLQRRAGLRINVEAAELMEKVGGGTNAPARALAWLLQKGFIPTKYADSFAIASGGATYYRNAIRKYKKQGLSEKEAEKKAWEDFTEITEATQQSSRPDLISMQQASGLGRPILAFANTPMQMFRRHKRRIQDIANNRGNMRDNILSAVYYGAVQTMIFSYLANAMFAVDDESDDPKDIAFHDKKKDRHINTILDSYLRGMGTGGAAVAALKNGIIRAAHENKKDYNADYGNVVIDMLNVSPPIGSKARKIYSTGKTWKYNKEVIPEMGLSLDNPAVLAVANVISAITNIPVDRAVMKAQNLKDASNSDFETWQRIAMFMGLNKWALGVEDEELEARMEAIEKRVKKEKKREKGNYLEKQKQERKQGKKDVKCADVSKSGNRCRNIAESGSSYCTIHARVAQKKSGKKTQCKGTKTNGQRCKMQTSSKSGYCYYHD